LIDDRSVLACVGGLPCQGLGVWDSGRRRECSKQAACLQKARGVAVEVHSLGTDLSVGVVVGVGSGSRIHLVCLSVFLPPLPLKDAAFSTRTIRQSCSHAAQFACQSSVSKQYGQYGPSRPLSPSPGPGTLSRWQHVLLYLTDPYGKSPRYFEPAAPSGCFASARAAKYPTAKWHALHTQQHTHHTSLSKFTNLPHHFPLENSQRHRSLLAQGAALASMQTIYPASLHPANRNRLSDATQGLA
jgi:hypothetical protein